MNSGTTWAAAGCIVAIVSLIVSITVPEVRQKLGLPNPDGQRSTVPEPITSATVGPLTPLAQASAPDKATADAVKKESEPTGAVAAKSQQGGMAKSETWAVVKIQNSTTNWSISYCIEDDCDNTLAPGYEATHWTETPPLSITFSASTGKGAASRSYDLDGAKFVGKYPQNAHGTLYVFQVDQRGNVDLFRQQP